MAQKAEFVQLDTSDDVVSVRDRLQFYRGQRVLLVWPEVGTALTRKLDLVLVQREAMRRNIQLAVVTHDERVTQHAAELNISTFETIGASERKRWKRGRSNVFASRYKRPVDEPVPDDLKPVVSRLREEDDKKTRTRRFVGRVAMLLVLLGLIGGVAYLVVPSATVRITPKFEEIPVRVNILADPNAADIDIESATVPATVLRVDINETGTTPTSGSQGLNNVSATGSVVFINQTEAAVVVPAGTTISTSAGTPVLFRTTSEATVSAGVGTQVEVPIEAMPSANAESGNVEANLINTIVGDLSSQLTVRNLSPTQGGESRSVGVVTGEDRERLLTTLRQQIQARAYLEMEARRTASQVIVLESIRIVEERDDWKEFSAEVGDVTGELDLNMRATVQATAVEEALARQIALSALDIPSGMVLQPDAMNYQCCRVQSVDADGRALLTMTGSATLTSRLNPDQLREQLAGRSLSDAYAYLLTQVELAEDQPPQITLSPAWLTQMPLLSPRIRVFTQTGNESDADGQPIQIPDPVAADEGA